MIAFLLLACLASAPADTSAHSGREPWLLSRVDAYMSSGRIARAGRSRSAYVEREPFGISAEYGTASASEDFEFLKYLLQTGHTADALALTCSDLYGESDTLHFLRACALYQADYRPQACETFEKISAGSPFWNGIERIDVSSLEPPGGKSVWLGCAASAIVPGLGKIYAGRLGEGVAAFLFVGALAAMTAESWVANGPSDWRTILFGATGAVFYISNIYGTSVSIRISNAQAAYNYKEAVSCNLSIPLDRILR